MAAPRRLGAVVATIAVLAATGIGGAAGDPSHEFKFYPLLGHQKLLVRGSGAGETAGAAVAGLGDVNGDGVGDVAIGVPGRDVRGRGEAGLVVVAFGGGPARVLHAAPSVARGLAILGAQDFDHAGATVAAAGDVNGDGLADVIVGAPGASRRERRAAGAVYVVFGRPHSATIDLTSLGSGGYEIDGGKARAFAGAALAGVGDLNGDHRADLLLGAPGESPSSRQHAGAAYLVWGKADSAPVDLATPGTAALSISGAQLGDAAGSAVAAAGDVDADGHRDLLVGAPGSQLETGNGSVYVLEGPFAGDRDLSNLSGARALAIRGTPKRPLGYVAAGVGDVNGDHRADVALGSPNAGVGYRPVSGALYVVLGRHRTSTLRLAAFKRSDGFLIRGAEAGDRAGTAVAGAGDFNGDGLADVLVGAPGFANVLDRRGGAYVVYGRGHPATVDLARPGNDALRLLELRPGGVGHEDRFGAALAAAGDVDRDGLSDVLVGSPDAVGPAGPAKKGAPSAGQAALLTAPRAVLMRGVRRAGRFLRLRARCLAPGNACQGSVVVRSAARLRCGRLRTDGPTPVAHGRFIIPARRTGTMTARLSARGRRLVRCFLLVPANVLLTFTAGRQSG